jgi:hypothetical protein
MKRNGIVKKHDVHIILGGFLFAVIAWLLVSSPINRDANGQVVIYRDGYMETVVPLDKDDTITVTDEKGNINIIEIKEGKVKMLKANCPDQICVLTHPVNKDGQSIVCLPNRIVVEIISSLKEDIDGVSE